jgi:hypothetical protein
MMIKQKLFELITEPDNKTVCPARIMGILGGLQFLALAGWHFAASKTFDPQAYAIGFAAYLSGLGVALGLKKDTPKDDGK